MTKSTKITEEVTEEVTEEKTPLVLNIDKPVSSIKTAETSFKTAKEAISKKAMFLTVYCGEYFVIHGKKLQIWNSSNVIQFLEEKNYFSHLCCISAYILYETLIGKWVYRLK